LNAETKELFEENLFI